MRQHAFIARDLVDAVPEHPLRALDALHLAIAQGAGSRVADRVMAEAAEALGFEVHSFG
jgi:predicted nucleic acid-binding protein